MGPRRTGRLPQLAHPRAGDCESRAVAGDLVRMWIEVHHPDVAPEVAKHEDDLIWRGDWRSSREVRRYQHVIQGEHRNGFTADESIGVETPRTNGAANDRIRARGRVIEQPPVRGPEGMAGTALDRHPL